MVYNGNAAPFLDGCFNTYAFLVSYDPSRKSFLAKLAGITALVGLAPRLVAKSVAQPAPAPAAAPRLAVAARHDSRSVARRPDSV